MRRHQLAMCAENALSRINGNQRAPNSASPCSGPPLVDAEVKRDIVVGRCLRDGGNLRSIDLHSLFKKLPIGTLLAGILKRSTIGPANPERVPAQKCFGECQKFD